MIDFAFIFDFMGTALFQFAVVFFGCELFFGCRRARS
jgi:hypothetical protein